MPSKWIDQYVFEEIPVWFRVFGLPLGKMEEDTAVDIGNLVGRFVEMDTGADGSAMGRFLRIKVCMPINKPLMRGIFLDEEIESDEEAVKVKEKVMRRNARSAGLSMNIYRISATFVACWGMSIRAARLNWRRGRKLNMGDG